MNSGNQKYSPLNGASTGVLAPDGSLHTGAFTEEPFELLFEMYRWMACCFTLEYWKLCVHNL